MRVIAIKTLKDYANEFYQAEQALYSWHDEAVNAEWNNAAELKMQYKNASIINSKRVVFNIHGNSFRLIVDVEYRLKIVFIESEPFYKLFYKSKKIKSPTRLTLHKWIVSLIQSYRS